MEDLNQMITKANVNGWLIGFKDQLHGNMENELGVTHLLYANDSLIFCEVDVT